jgi:hypothetical protein
MKKNDKYYCIKLLVSVIINIFTDGKLLFHLLLFLLCLFSLFIDYRFITGLLIDVIKNSKFLMMIAIVVWESKMQLLALENLIIRDIWIYQLMVAVNLSSI